MHLVADGLAIEIRRFLKGTGDDTGDGDIGVTKAQLAFWPKHLRSVVEDINRARVFVPSRKEFVLLSPECITPKEVDDAGEYLIAKGEDCIRVGTQLTDLAERMKGKPNAPHSRSGDRSRVHDRPRVRS
jgi:hypothetical protein